MMLEKLLTTFLPDFDAEIASAEAELTAARVALADAERADAEWLESWLAAWWKINLAVGNRPIAAALESRLGQERQAQARERQGDQSASYWRQVVANLEWRRDDLLRAKSQAADALAGRAAHDAFNRPIITAPASRAIAPAVVDDGADS